MEDGPYTGKEDSEILLLVYFPSDKKSKSNETCLCHGTLLTSYGLNGNYELSFYLPEVLLKCFVHVQQERQSSRQSNKLYPSPQKWCTLDEQGSASSRITALIMQLWWLASHRMQKAMVTTPISPSPFKERTLSRTLADILSVWWCSCQGGRWSLSRTCIQWMHLLQLGCQVQRPV